MRRWCVLLLLALLACRESQQSVRETALRDTLDTMRKAIANFRADKGRHPHSLQELVPNYVYRIPTDPITRSATTWKLTTEETVHPSDDFSTAITPKSETVIIDVHSGASGTDSRGTRYADY